MSAATTTNARLYLVDSSIYIFRAWHTLPDSVVDPEGRPINAAYGFAEFLLQLLEQTRASTLVCAFDLSLGQALRNEIFPDYKANRPPAPPELKHQFERCREIAAAFGLWQHASPQYEADDIIGTLASMAREHGTDCTFVTADKDLTQFVGERDVFWNFARNERHDWHSIKKRFGVWPTQIADMLALSGDKVDNIPGIPGVGQTTAARLLTRWKTLDALFDNTAKVSEMKFRGAARVATLLPEYESVVRLSRQLTGLLPVPDLPASVSELRRQSVDHAEATRVLTGLGFSERRTERALHILDTTLSHSASHTGDNNNLIDRSHT